MEAPERFFELDIRIPQGNDYPLVLRFADADGVDLDISTWVFTFTAKRAAGAATPVFTIEDGDIAKTAATSTVNTATILITDTQTAISPRDYAWSVDIVDDTDTISGLGVLSILKKA